MNTRLKKIKEGRIVSNKALESYDKLLNIYEISMITYQMLKEESSTCT